MTELNNRNQKQSSKLHPECSPKLIEGFRAYEAALPELLKLYPNRDHWVAFHGKDQVGVNLNRKELILANKDAALAKELAVKKIRPKEPDVIYDFFEIAMPSLK